MSGERPKSEQLLPKSGAVAKSFWLASAEPPAATDRSDRPMLHRLEDVEPQFQLDEMVEWPGFIYRNRTDIEMTAEQFHLLTEMDRVYEMYVAEPCISRPSFVPPTTFTPPTQGGSSAAGQKESKTKES